MALRSGRTFLLSGLNGLGTSSLQRAGQRQITHVPGYKPPVAGSDPSLKAAASAAPGRVPPPPAAAKVASTAAEAGAPEVLAKRGGSAPMMCSMHPCATSVKQRHPGMRLRGAIAARTPVQATTAYNCAGR